MLSRRAFLSSLSLTSLAALAGCASAQQAAPTTTAATTTATTQPASTAATTTAASGPVFGRVPNTIAQDEETLADDAGMRRAEGAREAGVREGEAGVRVGQDDEVVAGAVHLEEAELHGVAGLAGVLRRTAGFTSVPLRKSASESQLGSVYGPVARTAKMEESGEKR